MWVAGHIGITLGACALMRDLKAPNQGDMLRSIAVIAMLAIMPDILDRSLHLIMDGYPRHGIFHSLFFYAAAIPFAFAVSRRACAYLMVMGFNVALDVVNTDLRVFVYPVFGLSYSPGGDGTYSPLIMFLEHWPRRLAYRLPTGHYAIFELIGTVLIVWVLWRVARQANRLASEQAGKLTNEEADGGLGLRRDKNSGEKSLGLSD